MTPAVTALVLRALAKDSLPPLRVQFRLAGSSNFLLSFACGVPILLNFVLLVTEDGLNFHVDRAYASAFVEMFALNLLLAPLFAEIGWRGYLLPTLLKAYSFNKAVWVLAIIWATWLIPFHLLALRTSLVSFAVNFAAITALSLILAMLYLLSGGNLILPILFHASWDAGSVVVNRIQPTLHAHALISQTAVVWVVAGLMWYYYEEEMREAVVSSGLQPTTDSSAQNLEPEA